MDDQDFESLVRNSSSIGHRRSIRLEGYDYTSEGGYFITLVTHHHNPLFGKVIDDEMLENEFGQIVREEWFRTARLRPTVELLEDEFVVMPNHIHGIIWLFDEKDNRSNKKVTGDQSGHPVRAYRDTPLQSPSNTIGAIIRGFKGAVTTRINTIRQVKGEPVWLRNYYEHIITTETEYANIVDYIQFNPMNWGM